MDGAARMVWRASVELRQNYAAGANQTNHYRTALRAGSTFASNDLLGTVLNEANAITVGVVHVHFSVTPTLLSRCK